MSETWLEPKTWKAGEGLTPSKLNTYLRNQLNYLRYRNRAEASDTTDVSISGATVSAVDDNKFKISHSVAKNADVLLRFVGQFQGSSVNNDLRFDIFVDNSYYVSSLAASPLTRGLWVVGCYTINTDQALDFKWSLQGLSEGAHTFSLHAWRSAGTFTIKGTTRTTRISAEDY